MIVIQNPIIAGSATLPINGVVSGTYTNATITVDPTGLVTNASAGSSSGSSFTSALTVTVTDSGTTTTPTLFTLDHESSGTPAAGFGSGISFLAGDSTTANVSQTAVLSNWLVATHASRSSQLLFQTVSNAGALSTGLTVGSGISAATAGLVIGGYSPTFGGIWASGVATPSISNCAFYADGSGNTIVNATTGGAGGALKFSATTVLGWTASAVTIAQPITSYRGISTAGIGVPAIYASANITAQSSNATITSYANPAADGDYEVSATFNASAITGLSTSLTVTYTDVTNTAQTLILPVQKAGGTGGTYLTSGLIISTGDHTTPVHKIRVKASTTITILTAAGTFTGVTYSASGTIKQTA